MYLFIQLLACLGFSYLGNPIAAVLLEDGASHRISAFHSLEKDVKLQGVSFCFPFSLSSPPLLPSKHKCGQKEAHGLRGHNKPGKEDSVMKNSTFRYNVKRGSFNAPPPTSPWKVGRGIMPTPGHALKPGRGSLRDSQIASVSGVSQLCFGCFQDRGKAFPLSIPELRALITWTSLK